MQGNLDQFYTNPCVATKCFEEVQGIVGDTSVAYIEPAAGSGSFFSLLPEKSRIGVDVDPKCPGVKEMDFFDFTYEKDDKCAVVIGNPPFGRVSSLAIKFFNHSAKFADYICFIVPRTFKRVSVHNKLSLNFHLVCSRDLPEKGCFIPDINAKCCFQIWKKLRLERCKVFLPITCDDFAFVKYGPKDSKGQPTVPLLKDFDFTIKAFGSNCGKIFTENLENLRPKSYHFIKSKIDTLNLMNSLESLDYSISLDTVRQNSLGKADLVALYLSGKN